MTTDKPMTMVERVARALHPEIFKDFGGHGPGECPDCDEQRELARELARAAIEAMREPTQRMLDATWTDASAFTWRTMIDAALNEDQA